jgi:arsenate reductase (thioredoxin)
MESRPVVVFVCTGNSCRSQMAEGLLRARSGERLDVRSAGTHSTPRVHPLAVTAMAEIGIDISEQQPKDLADLGPGPINLAVTVCDHASRTCPRLPGAARQIHVGFDDPADADGTDEQKMAVFRRVRDEIAARLPEIERALGEAR